MKRLRFQGALVGMSAERGQGGGSQAAMRAISVIFTTVTAVAHG